MGLPIPIPSAPALRALPTPRINPFTTVPSGVTQVPIPYPAKIIPNLPPRLPPLNLAPLQRFFGIGSLLALPAAIVDLIGQAGAYKWRDNLLNQINGGNKSVTQLPPPFEGGQSVGVLYRVVVDGYVDFNDGTQRTRPFIQMLGIVPFLDCYGAIGAVNPNTIDNQAGIQVIARKTPNGVTEPIRIGLGAVGVPNPITVITSILINRLDGQQDTGGNLQNASIVPNLNPLTVPPIEPLAPPSPLPPASPVSPPLPLPPLAPPSPLPPPPPDGVPLPPPKLPIKPLNPIIPELPKLPLKIPQNPTAPPLPNLPELPKVLPKPIEIPRPNLPNIQTIINNQNYLNIINLININQYQQTNEANRLRKKEDCCEHEKDDILIGIPEWWQVRIGNDRPQAVVLVREILSSNKLGSCWSMSIPHYIRGKTFKPSFPDYFKGDRELIYTFKDNSKFIINCRDDNEGLKVWNYVKTLVNQSMLTGKPPRFGDRNGDYKKCKVRAVRLQFYSQGQKSINANDYVIKLI